MGTALLQARDCGKWSVCRSMEVISKLMINVGWEGLTVGSAMPAKAVLDQK